jgi:hypothetical protein
MRGERDGRTFIGLGYSHPDGDDEPELDPFERADMDLAAKCGAVIRFHYPGHHFQVVADHKQGIVRIRIPQLMRGGAASGPWWYIVKIRELDQSLSAVKRACGELLERFRLPRSLINHADWMAAVRRQPLVVTKDNNVVPA